MPPYFSRQRERRGTITRGIALEAAGGARCARHACSNGTTTPANLSPVDPALVPAAFWNNPLKAA